MKIRKIIVYLCVFAAAASIFTRIIYVNKVYPSVKIHNYNIGDTVNTDEYQICLDSVKVYEKAEWENYIDSTQIGRERDSYKADDKDAALKMRYNPDEDYARSITYIYQRLCGYLKSTQRFYIAFYLEEHPEEESPVDLEDEAMMSFGEPKSYLTFDDVRILTGLSKKELKKKLKEKQIVAMYDEDVVRQAFDEDIC